MMRLINGFEGQVEVFVPGQALEVDEHQPILYSRMAYS
jgi:ribosomal protein S12